MILKTETNAAKPSTSNLSFVSEFYTPIEQAVEELHQRRKSPGLQQKVRENLQLSTELEVLFERPHLVMFRQVLTPLTETYLLLELAKKYNLTPFVIEYYGDKFVSTGNQFKRGLGKLPIHQFTDKAHHEIFVYKTVVDFNAHVGHSIKSVTTTQNEPLVDFHHDLFEKACHTKPVVISRDGTSWFKTHHSSKEYYKHFLKLFLRDAILFETFITNDAESEFYDTVVHPAFSEVLQTFEHKPLIVDIISQHNDHESEYWDYYPKVIDEILLQKGYS